MDSTDFTYEGYLKAKAYAQLVKTTFLKKVAIAQEKFYGLCQRPCIGKETMKTMTVYSLELISVGFDFPPKGGNLVSHVFVENNIPLTHFNFYGQPVQIRINIAVPKANLAYPLSYAEENFINSWLNRIWEDLGCSIEAGSKLPIVWNNYNFTAPILSATLDLSIPVMRLIQHFRDTKGEIALS